MGSVCDITFFSPEIGRKEVPLKVSRTLAQAIENFPHKAIKINAHMKKAGSDLSIEVFKKVNEAFNRLIKEKKVNLQAVPLRKITLHLDDKKEVWHGIFLKVVDRSKQLSLYDSICLLKGEAYILSDNGNSLIFNHPDYVTGLLNGEHRGRLEGGGKEGSKKVGWCCSKTGIIHFEETEKDEDENFSFNTDDSLSLRITDKKLIEYTHYKWNGFISATGVIEGGKDS